MQYNAKKVNELFAIGVSSIARGTSSRSYNEPVGSHSGVNFIILHEPLVLCRDLFFMKRIAFECLMIVKYLYIKSNSQGLQSTN